MEDTGERMVPEQSDSNTLWEHLYRYKFAAQYVSGRRILDIACGEGYGAFALQSAGAASVVGVDISEETCRHAMEKYGINARVGNAEEIPLPNHSVDVVVSFETIEHVPSPERFLQECARVLDVKGMLVISTPNVEAFNPTRDPANNPFHCSEMSGPDFVSLLSKYFTLYELFSQVPIFAPTMSITGLLSRKGWWSRKRGYHRFVASRFPSANCKRESLARNNPVDEILRAETWFQRKLNPFAVRHHRLDSKCIPLYFLAVASGPVVKK